ncbi:MAG TPA: cell surface protein SprA, partial [Acidimicrobiia bacterium]|nr:cell surface protein SprA [Acidimicrobiia bacterium]
QDIDENSIELYVDDAVNTSQSNIVRGRAFVDPNNRCIDPVTCLDGPDADSDPDTTRSVRGTFRKLTLANQDYEILSSFYGPSYKVIRLRSPVTDQKHCLAVTYRYKESVNNQPVGDSVHVGGLYADDIDLSKGTRVPALTMKLLRAPLVETPPDTTTGLFSTRSPFYATRELELKNIYHLAGQNIDAKSFMLAIRQGNEQPPVTTVTIGSPPALESVPFIEILGLDNFDETSGFPGYDKRGHDNFVDATGPTNFVRPAIDFVRGTLFFPDPRPFAPRLAADTTGRRFDRFVDSLLTRRERLTGGISAANEANPDIYDKHTVLNNDAYYYLEPIFVAQTAGNEINLGRSNIIEGSDVVRINGQPIQRDKDYRIDYDLGRVTLIRQLLPADQLDIDYSYAPLFQQAGKTLLGSAFRLEGRDKSLGGAFLYESRGATDLRPRLGEEPSQVVIGDLNTDWKFKPSWMTRLADVLPGVRTSQPSELNIQAEMGVSLPNPNTRNEVFIDDMEGSRDAVSLSMGPERWRWSSVPLRTPGQTNTIDDPGLPNPQRNAEIHWYSPLNVVKERDLKPSLTQAQGAQNTHQSLAISIPRRPRIVDQNGNPTGLPDTTHKLWVGLTYPLDPGGIDLSRSQFIELWVNDFRDHHNNNPTPRVRGFNVKLHIDLGVVPEDQQRAPNIIPNGALDTEDRAKDGQLTVTEGNNEDTGLDSLLSVDEVPQPIPDLVTVWAEDPSGDDFELPRTDRTDWDPRKWVSTNGTEENKNVEPVPDTEDMNQNNRLDGLSDYFEYTIDLGDTLSPYLATDVYESYDGYAGTTDPMPLDNGWRRYRIPIDDKARQRFGNPVLETARHVRVWLEDIVLTDPAEFVNGEGKLDGRPFVVLGGIEIVGNRWLATDLDSTSKAAGTTLTLNTVNTTDNAEIYVPPFDPGSTRSGSQELVRREQTMAIEFTNLADRDTLEVFKTVSLDEDYSRYGKLNWYAAAYQIRDYVETSDTLDYFLRFASDERGDHYYEYRARLPRSSEPLKINWKEVSLALTELSNIKLNPDFPSGGPVLYYAPGRVPGEVFVIKGRPAFTRLRRISFGLINLSGKAFPSGQLWFNELRATDVAKDRGQAQRLSVNGRVANLVNYNFMYNKADAHFQAVGQNRGTGNTDNTISLQTGVDLHRFIESSRILLPFNYTYNRFMSSPRFTAGDDVVRTGALAEASDSRVMTRTMSLSYSRTWGDRSNPLLRYTLGGFTANINRSQNELRNPTTVSANTQTAAAVNYSIAPRQILTLGVPLTRLKIYPFPERFYWNYSFSTNEGASYNRERDSLGTLVLRNVTNARVAGIDFGMDSRPIDMFHHSFRARRNLTLPTELLERV